jgi:hypothetical protein
MTRLTTRKARAEPYPGLDRKAFIDIVSEGQGDIGGVLQPPPGGVWGMPPDLLKELPGYDRGAEKPHAGSPHHGESPTIG